MVKCWTRQICPKALCRSGRMALCRSGRARLMRGEWSGLALVNSLRVENHFRPSRPTRRRPRPICRPPRFSDRRTRRAPLLRPPHPSRPASPTAAPMDDLTFPGDIPEDVPETYALPGDKPDIEVNRELNESFAKAGINVNSALLYKRNERDFGWEHTKQTKVVLKAVRTAMGEIHKLMLQAEQAGEDAVVLPEQLQTAFHFLGFKWPVELVEG